MTQFTSFGPNFPIEAIRKGFFTISNIYTSEHRTFRITRRGNEGPQMLALKEGHKYTPFAYINKKGSYSFKKLRAISKQWQAFCDLVHSLITEGVESRLHGKGYVIDNSENCFVCGHLLTSPESIEAGIGPVCAGR